MKILNYTLQPLSREYISDAVFLYHLVFGKNQQHSGAIWLPATVYKREYEEIYKEEGTKDCTSWILLDNKKIIAITGLFTLAKDPHSAWISWFLVHPKYRRQGIGSALLEWKIKEARRRKKKYLKVYSSNHPRERASAYLYEKHGFTTAKKIPEPGTKYELTFRRLKL